MDKVVAGIAADLQTMIDEKIAANEWFAKRNLAAKKAEILEELGKEVKQRVLVNPTFYGNEAESDLQAHIKALNTLYIKINAVIKVITSHDGTINGGQALIDEYVEKIELANSAEEVDDLKEEFKDEYDKLKSPAPVTPTPSKGCKSGFVSLFNIFAVLGLVIIIRRKR